MVPGSGIEPPTPGFSIRCSTPELPRRDIFPWGPDPALTCRGQGFAVRQRPALRGPSGTPGKTSMFVFHTLVGVAVIEPATSRPPGERATRLRYTPFRIVGAGDESRTHDIKIGNLALYQLSYTREAVLLRPTVPSIRRSRQATELHPQTFC